jgi:general secretion pathway protein F
MGVFFQELHTLTGSGIAVAPACREVERRAPGQLRAVAADMAQAAESGEPISTVMESHSGLFYPWHMGVVRAAEAGGFLPEAFEQIARAYEVEWETRSALRLRLFVYGALGIPAILVSAPLLLTVAEPIPEAGWTPALVLTTVLRYSRTVSLPIAAGLLGLVLLWQVLSASAWFQDLQRRIVLRLPVAGRIAQATALDRYLATLGLMLRGGLPIASAAEEAALAAGNPVLTPKLLEFVPALREGVPLSSLLAQARLFDPDTLNMAATGEASGSLPDMLSRAAAYYREDSAAKRMMLVRAGGIAVGVLYFCVFGILMYLGMRILYDFYFRVESWVGGEDLGGVNW